MRILTQAGLSTTVLLVHAPYPGDMKFRGVPSSMLAAIAPFATSPAGGAESIGYLDPVSASPAFYGELAELLRRGTVRVVCISTSTAAIEETRRIATTVKALAPGVLVVAGGPHEDDCEEAIPVRLHDVDLSIGGTAEFALDLVLREFLARDETPERFLERLGTLLSRTRLPAGRCKVSCRTWQPGTTRTLDFGPLSANDLAPRVLPDRLPSFSIFDAPTTLPIMVSRGCPYGRCTFCAEAIRGGGTLVSSEFSWIERLHAAHPDAAIYFQDSIFPRGKIAREGLLPLLRDLGVEWGAQVYLRALTRGTVEELAAHGCTYLYTGLESASPDLLSAVGKPGVDPKLALERLGWMRDHGVRAGVSLMFGVMASTGELLETADTVRRTLDLAVAIRDAGVQVTGFYPNVQTVLPGTELARGLCASGRDLDFYRMPRAGVFDVLEDGGVGYNFATLDPSRAAGALAETIRAAALALQPAEPVLAARAG